MASGIFVRRVYTDMPIAKKIFRLGFPGLMLALKPGLSGDFKGRAARP
jgi:hypothetical protein